MLPALLTVLPLVLGASPGSLTLDPEGVLPLVLEDAVRHPPVLATSPFLIEWRDGFVCAGPATAPASGRCVHVGEDDGTGVTVRALGSEAVLVLLSPSAVALLSPTKVLFVAHDLVDLHVRDDTVDLGLRCPRIGPSFALAPSCGGLGRQDRWVIPHRLALAVKAGHLVRAPSRVASIDDGAAAIRVQIEGRKHAWLVDDGLWPSRRLPGCEGTLMPDASEAGPEDDVVHVQVCNARLDRQGHIVVDLDQDPGWEENRSRFARWLSGPFPPVEGGSPLLPRAVSLEEAEICVRPGELDLVEPRCGARVKARLQGGSAHLFAFGALCTLPFDDLQSTEDAILVRWDGEGGDACAELLGDPSAPCSSRPTAP